MLRTLAWAENEVRYYSMTTDAGIGDAFPCNCRNYPLIAVQCCLTSRRQPRSASWPVQWAGSASRGSPAAVSFQITARPTARANGARPAVPWISSPSAPGRTHPEPTARQSASSRRCCGNGPMQRPISRQAGATPRSRLSCTAIITSALMLAWGDDHRPTHSALSAEQRAEVGITDGLVRIAVGLESVEDLIADFQQALEKAIAE